MKKTLALKFIILLFSFFIAKGITDSFDILATGAWSGMGNLILFPYYSLILISIMSFIAFVLWKLFKIT